LAKGGIALANPPNSSFVFARWQQQFAIACFGSKFEKMFIIIGITKLDDINVGFEGQ